MNFRTEALRTLAQKNGIYLSYRNNFGEEKVAREDVIIRVLQTMGLPLEDDGRNIEEILRRSEEECSRRFLEPCHVVWEGEQRGPVLRLKKGVKTFSEIRCEVFDDQAQRLFGWTAPLAGLRALGIDGDAEHWELTLPQALPIGYYKLSIHLGRDIAHSWILVAPLRVRRPPALNKKIWGTFAPTYSLRRDNDFASGDYTALGEILDLTAKKGAATLATLPLLASFIEDWKSDPSPYSPASRLFWNDFFVDPLKAPELRESPEAERLLNDPKLQVELKKLRASDFVDYERIACLKRPIFEALARAAFAADGEPKSAALKAYVKTHPLVEEYARFRALCYQRKESWWCWSGPTRDGDLSQEKIDESLVQYYIYTQYLAHAQLKELADRAQRAEMAFYLDLPVGVHSDSFDVWKNQDLYLLGLAAGAPPDPFFTKGQNWGFPPFSPEGIRLDGYRHFRDILRHHLREAKILRVDHVMGFFRIYVVPHGFDSTEGVYIGFNLDEFLAVALIEAHLAGASVVGEDLGTVPDEIKNAMERHGLDRLFVFEYEASPHQFPPLRSVPSNVVASINTHDMPMFSAYWQSRDIDDRQAMGLLQPELIAEERKARDRIRDSWKTYLVEKALLKNTEVNLQDVTFATYRFLASSPAWAALVNLEDLWLEEKAQNVPGTYKELPNWRRKFQKTNQEIAADTVLLDFFEKMDRDRNFLNVQTEDRARLITDEDLYLFNEGTHNQLYRCMGAQVGKHNGQSGVFFSCWAPNADRVAVIGTFNGWNYESHLMESRGTSGVWEIFIPGAKSSDLYKFAVRPRGSWKSFDRADPFAQKAELAPKTASVITTSNYQWSDDQWMNHREDTNGLNAPQSIYEMHLGSWMRSPEEGNRWLSYREVAPRLSKYIKEMGFTHVELMPITEFPFDGSWGYQSLGYFAPTARFGSPDDFRFFINHLHQEGIGVILDWVPSHFPNDAHGLAYFDGTHLFEHEDPRKGFHPDWKSCIFNYGRNEVRSFLISSAHYWLDEFHIDGLRVDAVASMLYLDYSRKEGEWIPNIYGGRENLEALQFLRQLNESVYARFPGVQMIAEESTAWGGVSRPTYLGGLGFGMKWDMGWMHDTLKFFQKDAIHRKFHLNDLTFRGLYAFTENFCLSLSHDEVVHGKASLIEKMAGDDWQKFANLRLLYAYMWALSGKKLLFMGSEFAQRSEWNHEQSLDWHLLEHESHRGIKNLIADLNRLYRNERGLNAADFSPEGFEWLGPPDAENSVIGFYRHNPGFDQDTVLVVLNLTPVLRENYRVGVPISGKWKEILNTDAQTYWGSGVGNLGQVHTDAVPAQGRLQSLSLRLPPLAAIFLRPSKA